MATSIQIVGSKHEAFNDLDLLVIVGLLVNRLRASPPDGMLDKDRREWERVLAQYAPGCIDLKLGALSADFGKKRAMFVALSLVNEDLLRRGELILGTTLNREVDVPGVRFSDYKTSTLLLVARKLAMLLGHAEDDSERQRP
jgi:hypothetical protein